MSELYLMITVCDWSRQKKFLSFYHEKQLSTAFHAATERLPTKCWIIWAWTGRKRF